jgi:hypothetical protein
MLECRVILGECLWKMPLENTFGKVPRDAVVEVGDMCMYVNL